MDFPLDPDLPYYLREADLISLGGQFDAHSGIDWNRFLVFCEEREFMPGQALVKQFERDSSVYVLTHGELEVQIAAKAGGPTITIATIEPVAVIGEQSFLDHGQRTASVLAKSRATAYRLTRDAFDEMRIKEPGVASAFLLDIAQSLSRRARKLQAMQAGL